MGSALRDYRRLPVLLAAVGVFVSAYLQYLHVRTWLDPAAGGFCSVNQKLDCVAVALSPWSTMLGVPLATWGLLGFWLLLLAAWRNSRWVLPLSTAAAVASLALLVLELVTIGAVCLFCEVAHLASWLLLAAAFRQRKAWSGPFVDTSLLSFGAVPAVGVLLAFWLFVPAYWRTVTWKGDVPLPHGTTTEGHPWIGAEKPSLTVEEWLDYGCPHCQASSLWLMRKAAAHPNDLRIVRRLNPRMACRTGSPYACILARAALCAGDQGKFWQMDRWLFANQTGKPSVDLGKAAREVGLDAVALDRCMKDPKTYARAQAESDAARRSRLTLTPGYRIDGKRAQPELLQERIRALR